MAIPRSILLLAALLGILTGPVLAQSEEKKSDDGKGTAERWRELDGKTRKERSDILRKLLDGKTEKEKKEILDKLKELERKAMRDRLREKHRQYEEFKGRLLKTLSPPVRERYDKLSPRYQGCLVFHCMYRVMAVGRQRFSDSLTPEQRKELDALKGQRGYWSKVLEITDRRVLEAQTLEVKKELEGLPEKEREKRVRSLRTAYIAGKMRLVETEVVFPEAAKLLRKPKSEVEQFLKDRQPKGPPDRRPHHRVRMRLDRELHDLLHKIPEKHWKAVDDEVQRIAKIKDRAARKKSLDDLKARLRKLLPD